MAIIDARHAGSPNPPYGPTLNARISIAVLEAAFDGYAAQQVTAADVNQTIDTLAGVPLVYDLRTRRQLYT